MKKLKENKAITLVALVITIIILLILAGISIAQLTGNGLFEKAKTAKQESENAQEDENEKMAKYNNEIDNYINSNRNTNNSIPFIDTSNVIASIANESGWTETTISYTATQDCYILGRIGAYGGGYVVVEINDVDIAHVGYWDNAGGHFAVNYILKQGDKIEFNSFGGNKTSKIISAYGIKY